MPELSFGSHMFQDLVEADILYIACMENKQTLLYTPEFLNQFKEENLVQDAFKSILKVFEVNDVNLIYDNMNQEVIVGKI